MLGDVPQTPGKDGQVGESPWLLCLALFRTGPGEEAGGEESEC